MQKAFKYLRNKISNRIPQLEVDDLQTRSKSEESPKK